MQFYYPSYYNFASFPARPLFSKSLDTLIDMKAREQTGFKLQVFCLGLRKEGSP